jgi:L-threonylcarbamoyladenylate synthase
MVLPRSPEVPDAVTAGGPTVGIRWPSHPIIQAVIRACGFPLAAPSANRSTEVSSTNAAHAQISLGGVVPLIVDGGQSQVGIESTVVDLSESPPRLLRPGMIHAASIAAALGEETVQMAGTSETLRSPGLMRKHYAPKAKVAVFRWKDESDLARQVAPFAIPRPEVHIVAYGVIPLREKFGRVSVVPHDAEAYARALYSELRQCDEEGARLIVVEAPPSDPAWSAIADRLTRASSE